MPIDYFMRIDGIPGESTNSRHVGEIDIISFSFGLHSGTGHSQGGSSGKVAFQDLHFTASINKASPKLFLACASGQHVKSAVLTGERPNGRKLNKFLEIELRDVLVSSYQASGHQGQEPPIDEVSVSFRAIKFTEVPSSPKGTPGQPAIEGWDLAANHAM